LAEQENEKEHDPSAKIDYISHSLPGPGGVTTKMGASKSLTTPRGRHWYMAEHGQSSLLNLIEETYILQLT
jgi:hypothetical protein